QTRTALQLAVQYPHIAVTYLPLACTGATIDYGLFGSQRFRECPPSKSNNTCQGTVNSQLAELREALTAAKRRQPDRTLDLVLLSIGANDIYFSGLAGFEIHPSFNAEPRRLAAVSAFVDNEFLPQLKAMALCQGGILCRNPQADRMTFVDSHQAAFVGHGFCMRAQTDPEFDRDCF